MMRWIIIISLLLFAVGSSGCEEKESVAPKVGAKIKKELDELEELVEERSDSLDETIDRAQQ